MITTLPLIPNKAPVEARYVLGPAADYLVTAAQHRQHAAPGAITPDGARLDARLLLASVMGRDDAVLPHEMLVTWCEELADAFKALLQRRACGEPVSRIRGWREFWSLRFEITPATLDPRPDSETLVQATLAWVDRDTDKPARVLDLGTGSGALLLACLSELPYSSGVGLDISPDAIEVALRNADALALADRAVFHCADFARGHTELGQFDIVLCNPPYIPSSDILCLAPDVADFEPMSALDGGDDGLDCWRAVLPTIQKRLAAGGRAFLEIGAGQGDGVAAIALMVGLSTVERHPDLSGEIRCLELAHES